MHVVTLRCNQKTSSSPFQAYCVILAPNQENAARYLHGENFCVNDIAVPCLCGSGKAYRLDFVLAGLLLDWQASAGAVSCGGGVILAPRQGAYNSAARFCTAGISVLKISLHLFRQTLISVLAVSSWRFLIAGQDYDQCISTCMYYN